MANIDTYLENIMQARYGRDVRQSIHDGIEAINEDAENAVDIATQAKGEAKTAQAFLLFTTEQITLLTT